MCQLGTVFFFKTEEVLEVFTTKQNFGEKEYNFFCVVKSIMMQGGAISKEVEKRRGIKPQ